MHDFFGRHDELARIRSLGPGDVLCVLGPGGVGKTRLVLEGAAERDALVVDLSAARTTASVVSVVANTLRAQVDDVEEIAALARAVDARGVDILVLDNVEQLEPDAIEALGELAGSAYATVVTSRVRIGAPFDDVLEVGPLDVDAAVKLLCRRALLFSSYFDDVDEDSPAVRRICERLERLPLVVELAAGSLRFMTVAELEAQIERELDAARQRGVNTRHRSLSESLAWSMELLSDDGRRALARAAAFAGGFHVSQFELATGWDAGRVRAALGELLDANLTRHLPDREQRRIAIYESARSHVGEVAPEEFAAAVEAHAGAMTSLAVEHAALIRTPDEGDAMRWIVRERDNLRAAWDVLLEARDPRLLKLAVAIAEPLRRLGPSNVVERALANAAELAVELGELEAFARLRLRQAHVVTLTHRDDHARELLDQLVERVPAVPPDVRAEMLVMRSLMPRLGITEDPLHRLQWLEEAESLAADIEDEWLRITAHGMKSTALLGLGREDEAFECLHEARRESLRFPCPSLRLRLGLQLARMERRNGNLEGARALVAEAEEQAAHAHEIAFELDAMLGQASLLYHFGRYDESVELYARIIRRSEQTALTSTLVTASAGTAAIFLVEGEYERALDVIRRCEQVNSSQFFSALLQGMGLAASGALGRIDPDDERFDAVADELDVVGRRHAQEFAETFRLYALLGTTSDLPSLREAETAARRLHHLEDDPEISFIASGALRLAEERIPSGPRLLLAPDYAFFQFEDEDRADIANRHVLKRLLERLVQHHRAGGAEGLDVHDLVEAGWPDEIIQPDAAATRLYTSVRYLRNLGLRDALIRDENGYLLDPTLRIETAR